MKISEFHKMVLGFLACQDRLVLTGGVKIPNPEQLSIAINHGITALGFLLSIPNNNDTDREVTDEERTLLLEVGTKTLAEYRRRHPHLIN